MQNLLLCLLLLPLLAFAQKREVFRIDNLPKEGVLLNQCWKWHAGSNEEWTKTVFDDTRWESIDPTKELYQLPQIKKTGVGFLRLRLWVDSSLVLKPMTLTLRQNCASEIYLNGKRIYSFGKVNKNPHLEKVVFVRNYPFAVLFRKAGVQVLAIRFSNTRSLTPIKYRPIDYPFFSAILAGANDANAASLKVKIYYAAISYYKFGIFAFLALLHFLLFISYPKQKANLFVCFYLLSSSFSYFVDHWIQALPVDVKVAIVLTSLAVLCSFLMKLFLIRTTQSYLNHPKDLFFWFWVCLLLCLEVMNTFIHSSRFYFLTLLGTLIVIAESLRISFLRNTQNQVGVRFILVGSVVYLLFMSLFFLMILGYLQLPPIWFDIFTNIAFMGLPISFSAMLATDMARTNKVLSLKLEEIQTLSTEKQRILATQNETLELQVSERTAKLKQSLDNLQKVQAQLIQSEKLASLGELTAGIAHEIQNPLNFVNNFAEVSAEMLDEMHEELEKGDTTEAIAIATDLKTNLEKINHHGQRASSIVKGMLEHSRASTGVKEPTDLNALADEYLRMAYHGLRAKDNNFNATLETHFDPDLPKVSVIPQDIGRVLLNLINNAFYAIDEKQKQMAKVESGTPLSESFRLSESYTPTISLRTKRLDNAVEISIKDNGNGIPESICDKIFQPFFTTKPTGQGTGLGLSLAYDIVTKGHGGKINFLSTAGQGTTFTIWLPITV